jgi:hypothetical protein
MASNIISDIISMIAPAAMDRIAAALGLNKDVARQAIAVAVPALLAALGSKAASPAGASALFNAVSKADPNVSGNLAGALTGNKSTAFMQGGSTMLSSLLGDSTMQSLTGAVAKQAGLGSATGASLMAIAGQLAMGALAKNASSSNLDAAGLASFLGSQQNNIKAALPVGLGNLLSGASAAGSGMAGGAQRAAAETSRAMPAQAKSMSNMLTYLIPLVAVAGLLWYFLGQGTAPPPAPTATAPAASEIMVDGVNVGQQVTAALDGLKSTLGGITDAATAQAALPKLQETTTAIDGVSGMLGKLSPEQKTALGALVTAALPAIKDAAAKVLAIPGVGDVAKPAVDGLMAKLDALAKPA